MESLPPGYLVSFAHPQMSDLCKNSEILRSSLHLGAPLANFDFTSWNLQMSGNMAYIVLYSDDPECVNRAKEVLSEFRTWKSKETIKEKLKVLKESNVPVKTKNVCLDMGNIILDMNKDNVLSSFAKLMMLGYKEYQPVKEELQNCL